MPSKVHGKSRRPASLGLDLPPPDGGDDAFMLRAAELRGLAAVGAVVTRLVSQLLAVEVEIEPVTELRNEALAWYVGLDAEATCLDDALWNGGAVDEPTRARLIRLYRLKLVDATDIVGTVMGKPVFLMMAMTPDKVLRLKPQYLVTGLPIRHLEAVN